uniref:Terpene synthase metal-binding domain-containing protein n=1 Tax=Oryza punctata TaxID=4537 RepID=A0A0E0KDP4_ORYPU
MTIMFLSNSATATSIKGSRSADKRVFSIFNLAVIGNLVEDAWKTINQARFERRSMLPVVNRVVANLAMSMMFLFQDSKDAYTFSKLNMKTIDQLFVKPIPI